MVTSPVLAYFIIIYRHDCKKKSRCYNTVGLEMKKKNTNNKIYRPSNQINNAPRRNYYTL